MGEKLVEIKNVSKEYGKGHAKVLAVSDVSIEVNRGEVALILGPSGSGKTTLLTMIGCILTPTAGEIIILGENISEMSAKKLAEMRKKHVGFVFQSFNLLKSLNAEENVEVALNLNGIKRGKAKSKAKEILTELGLDERLDFYPLDLSGGERQRVSIARALVNQPDIVLADEPTGNLDSKSGHKIGEMLKNLAKERDASVIVVTHDNRIEDIADRIYHLEDGRLKS